jgi:acetolactate decarboxylase
VSVTLYKHHRRSADDDMSIDERFIKALHVETLRKEDLHAELDPHVIFQTSTIDALLDGAYDGEVTFSQLRDHGDFGLGTFDACDGEMIAVDGAFFRAAVDGSVFPVSDSETTPFAVVTFFEPGMSRTIEGLFDQAALLALLDSQLDASAACHALRVDGHFDYVRARSVPRQRKPYPPLAEVAKEQRIFVFEDLVGTVVGFRFPDYAQGINVAGYHLHFVSDDRRYGGHVLDCRLRSGVIAIDHSSELHVELPVGIDAKAPDTTAGKRSLLDQIEDDS